MRLLCILGPTGIGKSEVALKIAKEFNGEIINCDSRQVFKNFPIITAQPTEEERKICPHHLYSFLDPSETINAGKFAELANKIIKEVYTKGHLPILVGGTGLYFKSILEGLAPIPDIPLSIRNKILAELKDKGCEFLYNKLKQKDPETASKLHPKDWQRISRALEVYEATGKPISWWQKQYTPKPKYDHLKIGLMTDLEKLKTQLKIRIEKMIEQGAIEEIKRALNSKVDLNSPVWSSIGCKELLRYLKGEISLEEAKKRWFKETKDYARRQIIWFKREKDILWFEPSQTKEILNKIRQWLLN